MELSNVQELVIEVHDSLVPRAFRRAMPEEAESPPAPPPWIAEATARLGERLLRVETEVELRAWLHRHATRRDWRALDWAMEGLWVRLNRADPTNPRTRELVARIVGRPTPLGVARTAIHWATLP